MTVFEIILSSVGAASLTILGWNAIDKARHLARQKRKLIAAAEFYPLPVASLGIEYTLIQPPRPIGIAVQVDKKTVAVVTLAEFKRAASRLLEAEARIDRAKP